MHDSIQSYLDAQNAVPCKDEDFALAPELEDMKPYIQDNRMADYQDHYYPSEMAVDAHNPDISHKPVMLTAFLAKIRQRLDQI